MGPVLPSGRKWAAVTALMTLAQQDWVLKIGLEAQSATSAAMFVLRHGAEEIFGIRIDTADLGLHGGVEQMMATYEESPLWSVKPSVVVDQLSRTFRDAASKGPLWVEFGEPCGYLNVLPWESMLREIGVPILRRPYFAVPSVVMVDPLRIVVIASSLPNESVPLRTIVSGTVAAMQDATNPDCVVDVFTIEAEYDSLREAFASEPNVTVHDPAGAPTNTETATQSLSGASPIISPWLRWVRQSMEDPVDVVVFACRGYVSVDQGTLAVAEAPSGGDPDSPARFIGTEELAAFLQEVGAWGVELIDAIPGVSSLGLRFLVDQLARARPGVAVLHDRAHVNDQQFASAWRFLVGTNEEMPISDLIVYCHPALVANAVDWGSIVEAMTDTVRNIVNAYTLADDQQPASSSAAAQPAWRASAQRYLEGQIAQLLTTPGVPASDALGEQLNSLLIETGWRDLFPELSSAGATSLSTSPGDDVIAASAGAADALKFVADVLGQVDLGEPLE
jgi:hypothetical protein